MATLNLILDTRRTRQDGTYPLIFRLRVKSKSADIQTGIKIPSNQFDVKSQSLKDPETSFKVSELRMKYQKKLNDFVIEYPSESNILLIKDHITGKAKGEVTILSYWQELILSLKNTGKLGNASVYEGSLSVIGKLVNLDVPFNKFNYQDILTIERGLLQRGVKYNSISVYLRSLRKICNDAVKLDYAPIDWYPFRKYQIKKEKTSPRILSLKEMKSYFDLVVPIGSTYYKSFLIGKLIFMMRGINLRDLLLLSSDNIKENRIIYRRSKTGRIYSVKLTPEINEILNLFTPNKTLLGILNDNVPQDKFITYYFQKRKVINKHLKMLGKMIDSKETISTYVFRYNFAHVCKHLGYSKDLIAEALGHQYGNSVTGIYLEQYDLELVDEMTEKVIKAVL